MRARLAVLSAALLLSAASAMAQPRTTLDMYVVDVEGGNATLFVTPAGESVLIDTGNANGAVRDAGRIMDAVREAHLKQLDHVIITHYHGDHFGGLEELTKQIPIKEFIDHGKNVQAGVGEDWTRDVYPKLYAKGKHTIAKPGDKIALTGIDWTIVASNGDTIAPTALPGANKPNPTCANYQDIESNEEDPMSVASYIVFGKFRTAHLGDLPRRMERKMMCPNTSLPPVDLFLGLHHGVETSNSLVMVHALHPRVAIMNNGTRKGGDPRTMMTLHTSPGLEDLWQIHFSQLSGQEYTQPGMFIANTIDEQPGALPITPITAPQPGPNAPPAPVHNGKAYWIKVSARPDGTFTVTNQRNGFSKTYTAPGS